MPNSWAASAGGFPAMAVPPAHSSARLRFKILRHRVTVMTTMLPGGDFAGVPELKYEEWRAVVRSIAGRWNPEGNDPNAFAGRVQDRSLFGLGADRFDYNAHRFERTQRDVRLDDVEFSTQYFRSSGVRQSFRMIRP